MVSHFAFVFPRFKLLSGAERLILKLAGALQANGQSISVVCHQFDPSCRPLLTSELNLIVTEKSIDFFKNRYANAIFDYFQTGSLIDLLPDDLDAVCCFGPALTLLPRIQKKRKIPVLYFCYEPPRFLYTDREIILERLGFLRHFADPLFRLYREKDRQLVRSANRVLSNSDFGRNQILETYGRDARVITHGLDLFKKGTRKTEIRGSLRLSEKDFVVMTANYLHPRKRIELFIESVNQAHRSNPLVKGMIVGDGPERAWLEKQANDSVFRFTGFVPEETLHEYFQSADLYLHTARLETFGLSVIEASANYLPVVSVKEGGPVETVIDGKTGFLSDASPNALAEAVLKIAGSPEKQKLFGGNGYNYVRGKYSWEKGAEDFLSAFLEIL